MAWRNSPLLNCMNAAQQLVLLVALVSGQALGQSRPGIASLKTPTSAEQPWAYTLTVDGFIVPEGTSYIDPVLTADHRWLHLEARYNEESLRTGSLWVGYNLSHGRRQLRRLVGARHHPNDRWRFRAA